MGALTEESLLRQLDIAELCIGGLLLRCESKTVLFALLTLDRRWCRHAGN